MGWMIAAAMGLALLRAETAMAAVQESCRLFVTGVLPGLLPCMVLSAMLVSRVRRPGPLLLTLLGWSGGSPTGARLLALSPGMTRRQQIQAAVATATMSPMFLLGTCGGWLRSSAAGGVLLVSVLLGGWLTGRLAGRTRRAGCESPAEEVLPLAPLTFGAAVEQAARTLLTVCGTMAMLRMFAALAAEALPGLALPLTVLLEVSAGVQQMASLPWPLPLRTAAIAGATGFGGTAILLQNRATLPAGLLSLRSQLLWQALHGGISFLLALGMMQLV